MNTSPKVAQLSGVQPRLGQDSAEMVCAPRLLRLSLPLNRAPWSSPFPLSELPVSHRQTCRETSSLDIGAIFTKRLTNIATQGCPVTTSPSD
ncbi:hypothetical protein SNK05_010164 [Fusarium graminearum]